MKTALTLGCVIITLMALGSTALAQTETRSTPLYRCGPDGRDLRDEPCPDGRPGKEVKYDQPSEAQVREARERAQRERKRADAMERERLKKEADARRNAAPAIGIRGHRSEPPAAAASTPKDGKKQPPKPKKVKRTDKAQSAANDKPAGSSKP